MASFITALVSFLAFGVILASGIAIPTTDTYRSDPPADAQSACGQPSAAEMAQLLADCSTAANPAQEDLSEVRNPCENGNCLVPNENDISQRAYCPWQVVIHSDPNRFPTDIAYSRCQSVFPGNNWNMYCDSVTYTKPVLVREDCGADNNYRYRCVHLTVPNGCVAARPQ